MFIMRVIHEMKFVTGIILGVTNSNMFNIEIQNLFKVI